MFQAIVLLIRTILLKSLEKITGKKRYHPENEELDHKTHWSTKIWITNVFRAWEWLFGRQFGIKKESSTAIYFVGEEKVIVYELYTLEAVLSYAELFIRDFLKSKLLPFRLVVTKLSIAHQDRAIQVPWIMFAIALDNTGTTGSGGSSYTYNHTITGSNSIIFTGLANATGTDQVSSVTYNGAAETLIQKGSFGGSRFTYLYYHLGDTAGSHTVGVNLSSSFTSQSVSVSYSGALQSGQPDSSFINLTSSSTSATNITTSVADNCWAFSYCHCRLVGAPIAGTGITSRGSSGSDGFGDSNGAIHPAGTYSMTWTQSASEDFNVIQGSFSPAASTTNTFSITDSLKYTVVKAVSVSKSLKYTIKASAAAITKSLKYTVKVTPAALTKSLQYIANNAKTIQKTLKYTVITPASLTKILTYTILLTPAFLTKTLEYTVKVTPAALTKSLQYAVVKAYSITKSLSYKLPGALIMQSPLQYAVKAAKSILKRLGYDINSSGFVEKYSKQNSGYGDKYSKQNTTYTDKY